MSNDNKHVFRISGEKRENKVYPFDNLNSNKWVNFENTVRALTFAGAETLFFAVYPMKNYVIKKIEKL